MRGSGTDQTAPNTLAMSIQHPNYDTFEIAHIPANPEPFLRINRIPIRDNNEPLVDLRERNPELLLTERCIPFVREGVSGMLTIAAGLLPPEIKLRVHTGLRTIKMQSDMYWKNYNKMREEHPSWPPSTLRRQCNRFFAPPDAKAPPGHCTGGAVDVKLCNEDGTEIDHSAPLEGWKAAPTATAGLSDKAAAVRRALSFVMHTAGFSNCRDEYWHWSYGDSAWAVRVGSPVAVYGLIEAPADYLAAREAEEEAAAKAKAEEETAAVTES